MVDPNYEKLAAISQSAIKDWKKLHPLEWKRIWIDKLKERKVTDPLRFGSLVDTMLFNSDAVDDLFITMEANKPSESVCFIIDKIANSHDIQGLTIEDFKDHIIEYAKVVPMPENKVGWGQGKGWDDSRVFNTVVKTGEDYFRFLKTTQGKVVVTSGEYIDALNLKDIALSNSISAKYFDPKYNKVQFEIVTDDEFPYRRKGLLDIVHTDDEAKTIQIVDFKTAESAFYFVSNIWQFGYLDQVAFYDYLLKWWLAHDKEAKKYEGYTHLPPINLVMDRQYKLPYIYEYNWDDITCAQFGYNKNGRYIKGIEDIIKDIAWHIVNDQWDYPREMYEKGKISLNLIQYD